MFLAVTLVGWTKRLQPKTNKKIPTFGTAFPEISATEKIKK